MVQSVLVTAISTYSASKASRLPVARNRIFFSQKVIFPNVSQICSRTFRGVPRVFPRLCATPTPLSPARCPLPSTFSAGPSRPVPHSPLPRYGAAQDFLSEPLSAVSIEGSGAPRWKCSQKSGRTPASAPARQAAWATLRGPQRVAEVVGRRHGQL